MFSIGYYLRIPYTYICNKKTTFFGFCLVFLFVLALFDLFAKSLHLFCLLRVFLKVVSMLRELMFFPNTIISLIIIKTKLKTYNKSVQLKCHIKYKTTYFIIKSQRRVIYRTFSLQPQNQIINKIHDYISYMEYTTPLKAYLLHKLKGNLQPSCC